jgi:hypothetical protein
VLESGEFRPVDPTVAARMLASMLVSHAVWCSRPDFFTHVAGRSDEQCLREITDFFLHSLLHDPDAPSVGAPQA